MKTPTTPQLEKILTEFQREFDRTNGNYKYNRKPILEKLEVYVASEKQKSREEGAEGDIKIVKSFLRKTFINGKFVEDDSRVNQTLWLAIQELAQKKS